jgi:hypothetical protein
MANRNTQTFRLDGGSTSYAGTKRALGGGTYKGYNSIGSIAGFTIDGTYGGQMHHQQQRALDVRGGLDSLRHLGGPVRITGGPDVHVGPNGAALSHANALMFEPTGAVHVTQPGGAKRFRGDAAMTSRLVSELARNMSSGPTVAAPSAPAAPPASTAPSVPCPPDYTARDAMRIASLEADLHQAKSDWTAAVAKAGTDCTTEKTRLTNDWTTKLAQAQTDCTTETTRLTTDCDTAKQQLVTQCDTDKAAINADWTTKFDDLNAKHIADLSACTASGGASALLAQQLKDCDADKAKLTQLAAGLKIKHALALNKSNADCAKSTAQAVGAETKKWEQRLTEIDTYIAGTNSTAPINTPATATEYNAWKLKKDERDAVADLASVQQMLADYAAQANLAAAITAPSPATAAVSAAYNELTKVQQRVEKVKQRFDTIKEYASGGLRYASDGTTLLPPPTKEHELAVYELYSHYEAALTGGNSAQQQLAKEVADQKGIVLSVKQMLEAYTDAISAKNADLTGLTLPAMAPEIKADFKPLFDALNTAVLTAYSVPMAAKATAETERDALQAQVTEYASTITSIETNLHLTFAPTAGADPLAELKRRLTALTAEGNAIRAELDTYAKRPAPPPPTPPQQLPPPQKYKASVDIAYIGNQAPILARTITDATTRLKAIEVKLNLAHPTTHLTMADCITAIGAEIDARNRTMNDIRANISTIESSLGLPDGKGKLETDRLGEIDTKITANKGVVTAAQQQATAHSQTASQHQTALAGILTAGHNYYATYKGVASWTGGDVTQETDAQKVIGYVLAHADLCATAYKDVKEKLDADKASTDALATRVQTVIKKRNELAECDTHIGIAIGLNDPGTAACSHAKQIYARLNYIKELAAQTTKADFETFVASLPQHQYAEATGMVTRLRTLFNEVQGVESVLAGGAPTTSTGADQRVHARLQFIKGVAAKTATELADMLAKHAAVATSQQQADLLMHEQVPVVEKLSQLYATETKCKGNYDRSSKTLKLLVNELLDKSQSLDILKKMADTRAKWVSDDKAKPDQEYVEHDGVENAILFLKTLYDGASKATTTPAAVTQPVQLAQSLNAALLAPTAASAAPATPPLSGTDRLEIMGQLFLALQRLKYPAAHVAAP